MKPTLKDIARKVGVNVSTVSRVLNNSAKISEEVKKRVIAMAEELNYYPNVMARALITKRSYTVGLVLPGFDFMFGGFFQEILRGIEMELDRRHYNLHLTRFSGSTHNSFTHSVRSGIIDGAMVLGDRLSVEDIGKFGHISVPVILLNRHDMVRNSHCASVDNVRGGVLAAEHLLFHGYRSFVFIGGDKEMHVTQERLRGFDRGLRVLRATGSPSDLKTARQSVYCNFARGLEEGYEVMGKVELDLKNGTGIFCANDHLAIGVLKYLREKSLAVGKTVGVVGYDNLDIDGSVFPALSSVDQKGMELGERAAKMLIDIIEGKASESAYTAEPILIRRASCGCDRKD